MEKIKKASKPWEDYIEPFCICNGVYFVGAYCGSSHLIDTGEGLILLDTGYPQTLYQIIANIQKLGFDFRDIKYIVHSHGHYDHLGATKALVELTGAKTFLGEPDRDYANGTLDLSCAKEIGYEYYETFEPDVLLHDGDVIKLGNISIRCVSTPGHTPGTISFFFDIEDDGKTYTCGMHGGVGVNSIKKAFLDRYGLPYSYRQDFINSLNRVRNEKVDIFLGNHAWNNQTKEKGLFRLENPDAPNPFIDPDAWSAFIDKCLARVMKVVNDPEQQEDA